MPVERRLEPFFEEQAERDLERRDQRDRRREGRVELGLRLARALPVEVEARRASGRRVGRLRDGARPEPGRRHQRLLRAGDDDVETPGIGLARNRAEARDRVDDHQCARLAGGGRDGLHVGDDPGRRLGVDDPDGLRLALAQTPANVVRIGRLAPRVAHVVDRRAVPGGHRGPPLAEVPRRDHEVRLAGRDEVRDRRLERARARCRKEQDIPLCPADVAQPREAALVDRLEVRAAVVDDRLAHRGEHLRRHGGRARREEISLLRHLHAG